MSYMKENHVDASDEAFRRLICGTLFAIKATASMVLSFGGFALLSYLVYDHRRYALLNAPATRFDFNPGSPECFVTSSGRLVPPTDKLMLGFHLDWQPGNRPLDIQSSIGYKPSIINGFYTFDHTRTPIWDNNNMLWHASLISKLGNGVMFAITMEPISQLEQITDSSIEDLTTAIAGINRDYGLPVLLRWGHEMNGDWTPYGMRPLAYIESFRRVARSLRRKTNITAMVWAPNIGAYYPFNSGINPRPPVGSPEFIALDTNRNGVISEGDDPYLPYYPGDEYADYVGLSVYYYPGSTTVNELPTANFISGMVGGKIYSEKSPASSIPLYNFYNRFAVSRNKPMIIAESGAPWVESRQTGPGEFAIKQSWWTQFLTGSLQREYPLLRGLVNFEEKKVDLNEPPRDWKLATSSNSAVKSAFRADVEKYNTNFIWANDIQFTCSGAVTMKV